VLDDGRITDSQGRTVDFKNTILIMTSNLGSSDILEGFGPDGQISKEARQRVEMLLRMQFRPEFLNRIDEIVFYKPLTRDEIGKIVTLLISSLQKRLEDRQIAITLTDAAREMVIQRGFDPVFGARPLKRFLQSQVETLVARKLVQGNLQPGQTLTVDVNDAGELYIRE
jgi:ATP-dependent Clp protease ATP-binding subunit ClpB